MKGYCLNCGKEIEVQMCCDGRECGCRGQPIDIPVCDEVCYDELMSKSTELQVIPNEIEQFNQFLKSKDV